MPNTPRHHPELQALQRSHLDARLNASTPLGQVVTPPRGWIHAIRTALGMSQTQLARRVGVTGEAVSKWESREPLGNITVTTLRRAAEALECDLLVTFVPRAGLQRTVESQAIQRATEERNRIVHTMRLENQDAGVDDALTPDVSVGDWLTRRSKEIWD